jgi:signal transduction histidine kinase/CheY-like chemotaxis protein
VDYIIHRVEDVTEYVRLRELGDEQAAVTAELRQRAGRMEQEILGRSQELQAANAELRKAGDAKNEFLSRMSHELRTPLAAILGFSELLSTRSLGEKPDEWARLIQVAGKHLLALVDEIMDLSRIEAGTVGVSPETVPVAPLIDEAFQLMRPVAEATGVQLQEPRFGDGARAAYVRADKQRLTQVVINLISNAVKYNRPGGDVAVGVAATDGDRLRISVSDTGPGIDAELIPRLFTPFERLGAAALGIEGTGLGLALSRRLVEAMGGTIGVDSAPARGATFWIDLVPGQPVAVNAAQRDAAVLTTRRYAGEFRVVYVEDVVANVHLVEEILTSRPQVRLLPAMLGGLGLELARRHRPHLILLDLHLPDMTGADVLAALRRDRATRDIPVVILTADATRREADRLRRLGAQTYLTKPITMHRLLDLIDQHADATAGSLVAAQPAS